jgi:hypothetical protein
MQDEVNPVVAMKCKFHNEAVDAGKGIEEQLLFARATLHVL